MIHRASSGSCEAARRPTRGRVPGRSSGTNVRRGDITKAGLMIQRAAPARRVRIEGAWTYRMQARVSRKLQERLERLRHGGQRRRLEGSVPPGCASFSVVEMWDGLGELSEVDNRPDRPQRVVHRHPGLAAQRSSPRIAKFHIW